jgi:hypothetical protein
MLCHELRLGELDDEGMCCSETILGWLVSLMAWLVALDRDTGMDVFVCDFWGGR